MKNSFFNHDYKIIYNYFSNKKYISHKLEVFDTNKLTYRFTSLRKASKVLYVTRDSIVRYINHGKLLKAKFILKIW